LFDKQGVMNETDCFGNYKFLYNLVTLMESLEKRGSQTGKIELLKQHSINSINSISATTLHRLIDSINSINSISNN